MKSRHAEGAPSPFCHSSIINHHSSFSLSPLAFSFLSPSFAIAGLLLAAIPIIIHILNRRRYRTVEWAAMDFLLRAMKKNRRRLRFESWLLLATRCAVVMLLGLALARPLSCADSSLASLGQRGSLHVLVIDNSYSMAYQANRPGARTNFDQAKKLAEGLIDRMGRIGGGGDSVAVISAGQPVSSLLERPTYDLQQARAVVDRLPQGYGGTDLAEALRRAIDIAQQDTRQGDRQLYLFTDATRSAWLAPAAAALRSMGPQLAKLYRVTLFNLSRGQQANSAVVDVHPTANLLTLKNTFGGDFTATVRGYGPVPPDATLQWRLDGVTLSRSTMIHPAPDTPPITQSQLVFRSGGPHVVAATLNSGDRLPIDDTRYRVVNVAAAVKVLIVEGQRGAGPLGGSGAFLQLALAPPGGSGSGASSDSDIEPELISDLELGNRLLSDYRAVILCGVGQIDAATADRLAAFVRDGGTLILFMGDPVTSENYNNVLLPRHLLPGPLTHRVTAADGNSFGFDFNPDGPLHPLLHAFAHQPKTGLDTAEVFNYWQADVPDDPQERVLNYRRTEPGRRPDPAITIQALGQGRVVFVSTTANPDWTTLPAKPAYVALVNELLAGSLNPGDAWMNLTVGQPLAVPATVKFTAAPTLLDPQQQPVALQPNAAGGYGSPPLLLPGIYTLQTGTQSLPVAVNVPPAEADVRMVDPAAITAALGGIDIDTPGDSLPALTAASVNAGGSDLGWNVMLCVLAFVGMECLLALRFGHYRRRGTN